MSDYYKVLYGMIWGGEKPVDEDGNGITSLKDMLSELNRLKEEQKELYLAGYYEGAGDDTWYNDHDDNGELLPDSWGLGAWTRYLKEQEK